MSETRRMGEVIIVAPALEEGYVVEIRPFEQLGAPKISEEVLERLAGLVDIGCEGCSKFATCRDRSFS